MDSHLCIKQILNNNVLIASHPSHQEVVLLGKGIGFGKKLNEVIDPKIVEKTFILKSESEQKQYRELLSHVKEDFIGLMNDAITLIKERVGDKQLHEHIHIALTDHVAHTIKRVEQGLDLKNPFLLETKTLYPLEYTIADEVVDLINKKTNIELPEEEIGFIALHIHSALENKHIYDINQYSEFIATLVSLVERTLQIRFPRNTTQHSRLLQQLHEIMNTNTSTLEVEKVKRLTTLLKEDYPLCYNLAWKIIKMMEHKTQKAHGETDINFLTVFFHRLLTVNK